jgi:glycosyltransferase involved in cell wall biosynthesis
MNPKVSVIIPTYKRSDFLPRAIDSILNQTYKNIEIIVVDDNNPDSYFREKTEKMISKYIHKNKIIYQKNESNLGGALARNQGIDNASGFFVTFLDDDDVYEEQKVEFQVKYMLENGLDASFTNVKIYNMEGKLIDYREHNYVTDLSNKELLKQHILHHLTPTDTYMFKRTSLIELGGFDNVSMGQEFRLMLKAIESDLQIGYLRRADVIQYIHDGDRISIGNNKIIAENELYKFKKKYFSILNRKQQKYVKFRHYAVLAVVGLRSKKYVFFVKNLFVAILISPNYFLSEFYKKMQIKKKV